jgi:hypothetical protein
MAVITFECFADLRIHDFAGFLPISELRHRLSCVPGEPGQVGVYVVLRRQNTAPKFKNKGSGGHFKGRNPNVPISALQKRWVENSYVIYIGKAGRPEGEATLRSRLQAFLSFGNEKRAAHWGGRFVWQLEDHEDLLVCWKLTTSPTPREVEKKMIQDFKRNFSGNRPFANLRD